MNQQQPTPPNDPPSKDHEDDKKISPSEATVKITSNPSNENPLIEAESSLEYCSTDAFDTTLHMVCPKCQMQYPKDHAQD